MSNHIHLVANCDEPEHLANVIRDFKKFTANAILTQIQSNSESRREWMLEQLSNAVTEKHKSYKFWQAGNHVIELYNERFAWIKINYIHDNPVKAGLVRNQEDWVYSSVSNYCDEESVLEKVHCIVPMLT
jgi:putative transposase